MHAYATHRVSEGMPRRGVLQAEAHVPLCLVYMQALTGDEWESNETWSEHSVGFLGCAAVGELTLIRPRSTMEREGKAGSNTCVH